MEYGSDAEYFKMVKLAIEQFYEWNELFNEEIYSVVGFRMLYKNAI